MNSASVRGSWGSRIGFIFAVAGSAVGLANIWRFPYLVGKHGGAAFIFVYILSLLLIGFPVFIAEILIGRATQTSPSGAFEKLGRSKIWSWPGKMTVLTGFIVSSFYSAVAGWIFGYFIEAVKGNLSSFASTEAVALHHTSLMQNPLWGVSFHFFFILICSTVLYLGVRGGIERWNKFLMPLLFIVLILLVLKGLTLPNAQDGLRFLFSPDWSLLTPAVLLTALGQAFFTLSVGQGTMVTYGSYLSKEENIVKSCVPILLMDTFVSIIAAMVIFTIAFSAGVEPSSGPALLFHTLPWVLSQIPGGYLMSVLFFLIVVLAALTSEISAMEPTIAYLIDEKGWNRHLAVWACGIGAFLLGIPSALSYSLLKNTTFFGLPFVDFIESICGHILIPAGGFFALFLLLGRWGVWNALSELKVGSHEFFKRYPWILSYFWFCFKVSAPILMAIIFLNSLLMFF
ncbi:sodium-dependent transporter [Parachlamydia acanthamoebae]|jgi:NSS family neurotransmitter:Na+ symporter|uniref:sodium-dependent transporter n=1 Tax=Parachlamydia acanthamoebae TaxID=83552 RepID=UPI0001C179F5|nr:sodium-dependent transporter [Parachlamydia acanthamoebae]EFB42813.1 hypothetical protein pah_c002o063 [Parachlamydia acanthamoebae str. Hall's coccus]